MKQTLVIPYKLPSMNDIIAAAHSRQGRYTSYGKMKKQHGLAIILLIKTQGLTPISSPVDFVFHWSEKRRNRDLDNIVTGRKFVLDALVDAGILSGDGWKQIIGFRDYFYSGVKDEVRVEINYLI